MSGAVELRRTAMPTEPGGEPVYHGLAFVAVHLASLLTRTEWRGVEKIPDGGVLIVANHLSNFDPIALGHFLLSGRGRWPRFIGKSDIWKVPVLGWLARGCGQIPVHRNTSQARDVVTAAADAIAQGKCVCIYPEGTITGDPGTWPMVGRAGAARIALQTGCPVIPIGQWGANFVMPGKKLTYPRLFPRKTMQMLVGDPVPLDDLRGQEMTHDVVAEANERIMDAITALVAELRGEQAPPDRLDLRTGQRVPHS